VSKPLTVGSLFAGIGGLELGLERAGMEIKWQVEIDDYANRVLERHWPKVQRWGDIRTFPTNPEGQWFVDVISAGVPCQPISTIGKQKSTKDQRWLWGDFLRVVATLTPKYVLVENPRGLLSDDKGRTFAGILCAMDGIGYDVQWGTIGAEDLGAAHERRRVFLVAYKTTSGVGQVGGNGRSISGMAGVCEWGSDRYRNTGRLCRLFPERMDLQVPNADGGRLQDLYGNVAQGEETNASIASNSHWTAGTSVSRVAHGVPRRVDRLRCLGNAVVPQVAEVFGRYIVDMERRRTEENAHHAAD